MPLSGNPGNSGNTQTWRSRIRTVPLTSTGKYSRGFRASSLEMLSALGIVLSLSACATNGHTELSSVKLGPGDLVRIVEQEKGAPPNAQPVRLEATELTTALASIRINTDRVDPDNPQGRQLFTDENLKFASLALADAFSRAGPREDVALRLAQLRSTDLLPMLRESHITAARMFYLDDRLHVILGKIDERPEHSFATDGTPTPKIDYSISDSARFYADEIGSRNHVRSVDWSPRLPNGVRFHNSERHDWVEIDLGAFIASNSLPATTTPSPSGRAVPVSTSEETTNNIEKRLRELRHLHEEGLISDELYQEKTRELVDSYIEE